MSTFQGLVRHHVQFLWALINIWCVCVLGALDLWKLSQLRKGSLQDVTVSRNREPRNRLQYTMILITLGVLVGKCCQHGNVAEIWERSNVLDFWGRYGNEAWEPADSAQRLMIP